jgi:hypothetical protein
VPETSNSSYGTGFGSTGAGEELVLGDVLLIKPSHQKILKNFNRSSKKVLLYRGSHKMFIQELPLSISNSTFIQAPIQSIFKISTQVCTTSSHKDLQEIT